MYFLNTISLLITDIRGSVFMLINSIHACGIWKVMTWMARVGFDVTQQGVSIYEGFTVF